MRSLLLAAAWLALFTAGTAATAEPPPKTTVIEIATQEWAPGPNEATYAPLGKVSVRVNRGGDPIAPKYLWDTDADKGTVRIEVVNGQPVTLIIAMSRDFAPEILNLTANGGTHKLEVALLSSKNYHDLQAKNARIQDLHIKFAEAKRGLVVRDPTEADKKLSAEMDAGVKATLPRAAKHPSNEKPPPPAKMTNEEKDAVRHCLGLLRSALVDDVDHGGAFAMASNGTAPWIHPYYGSQVALALLAGVTAKVQPDKLDTDLDLVIGWLNWYAKHLDKEDGWIPWAYAGPFGAVVKTKDYADNAVNAIAGRFLRTVARTDRLLRDLKKKQQIPDKVLDAAVRSLAALNDVMGATGLTFDNPDATSSWLHYDAETYAGLVEGGAYFQRNNRPRDAERAFAAADQLARGALVYCQKEYFAVTISDGDLPAAMQGASIQARGDLAGLACGDQLLRHSFLPTFEGIPFISGVLSHPAAEALGRLAAADLRKRLGREPKPDPELTLSAAPLEMWVEADTPLAMRTLAQTRSRLAQEALKFNRNTYTYRSAGVALALIGGPARLPAMLPPSP